MYLSSLKAHSLVSRHLASIENVVVRGLKINLLGLPAIIELNLAAKLNVTIVYDSLAHDKFPTVFQG